MMDPADARAVLGVAAGAAPAEVRAAYLRLVLANHPDRLAPDRLAPGAPAAGAPGADGADRAGARRIAAITEAYAVLRSAPAGAAAQAPARPAARADDREQRVPAPDAPLAVDPLGDVRRVCLGASLADAFGAVLESLHALGHVSYVDRSSAVLEVVVTPAALQATSMLVVLETPADARFRVPDEWDGPVTVATICVEPLGRHPPAPLDDLVERLAELLARDRRRAP